MEYEIMNSHVRREPAGQVTLACAALLMLGFLACLAAGEPRLVKDIQAIPGSSDPRDSTEVAGKLFFTAYEPASGRELWVSDGTAEGTRLVKDVVRGSEDRGEFRGFQTLGDRLLFWVDDPAVASYSRLWVSDGTEEGTILWGSPDPLFERTEVDGRWFFLAFLPDQGVGLWVTDPARTNRLFLAEVIPAAARPQIQFAWTATGAGGRYFLLVANALQGFDLWVSDGTPEGTRRLREFGRVTTFSHHWGLTPVGDRVFFVHAHYQEQQLWVSAELCGTAARGRLAFPPGREGAMMPSCKPSAASSSSPGSSSSRWLSSTTSRTATSPARRSSCSASSSSWRSEPGSSSWAILWSKSRSEGI
jgi:ELWxxDGT repeat protein